MYHVTRKASQKVWYEYLRDFYRDDLLIGRLDPERYWKKLRDSFDFCEISAETAGELYRSTAFAAYPEMLEAEDRIWILEENEKSAFFYDFQKRFFPKSRPPIFLIRPEGSRRFQSEMPLFQEFLQYYRGIGENSLERLDAPAMAYLQNLHDFACAVTNVFGPGVPVRLVAEEPDHRKYFIQT